MAYCLGLDENIGRALKRIGAEQLERALAELRGRDAVTAVHQTRKCIKRLRALLRLVRPGIDKAAYRRLNSELGNAGRMLSATRDSDVLVQTAATLAAEGGGHARALRRLGAALAPAASRKGAVSPAATRRQARAMLEWVAKGWRALALSPDTFAPIANGLEHGLADLSAAFEATADGDDDDAFHDLRKTVQRHWRHMRLVEAGWPAYFSARAAEAKTISDLLGNAQDLTLLIGFLDDPERSTLSATDKSGIAALARQRRASLRAEARGHTARLVAEGAGAHARRAAEYWATTVGLARETAAPAEATMALATATRQPRKRSPRRKTKR